MWKSTKLNFSLKVQQWDLTASNPSKTKKTVKLSWWSSSPLAKSKVRQTIKTAFAYSEHFVILFSIWKLRQRLCEPLRALAILFQESFIALWDAPHEGLRDRQRERERGREERYLWDVVQDKHSKIIFMLNSTRTYVCGLADELLTGTRKARFLGISSPSLLCIIVESPEKKIFGGSSHELFAIRDSLRRRWKI